MRNPSWGPRNRQQIHAAWTPTDGSGAGLTLTVTSAGYRKIATNLVWCRLHISYPVTADATASQIDGLPFPAAHICSAAVYTNDTGGATVAKISSSSINIFAPKNVAITNANLSGAVVHITFTYEI